MNIRDIMPKRFEPPKDEPIKYVKLANPKLEHHENLSNGMPNYNIKYNIKAQVNNIADKTIYDAIIKYATEQGITDLFLIDEEFVKSALLNEAKLREPAHQVADARRPRTKSDKKDERVQIVKGGRLLGKTAQMKLESFDALLDAYMELVEEKKKQDPNYKPKIVYVGMKYRKPKPRTNFDRITESEEALAEFIETVSNCTMIDCKDCPLSKAKCNSKDGIKEWLQKECEG